MKKQKIMKNKYKFFKIKLDQLKKNLIIFKVRNKQ